MPRPIESMGRRRSPFTDKRLPGEFWSISRRDGTGRAAALNKEFMVADIQFYEARAYGRDPQFLDCGGSGETPVDRLCGTGQRIVAGRIWWRRAMSASLIPSLEWLLTIRVDWRQQLAGPQDLLDGSPASPYGWQSGFLPTN